MAKLYTRVLRVQALLRRSNSPTSRSSEAVNWIMRMCVYRGENPCACGGGGLYRVHQVLASPRYKGFKVHQERGVTGNASNKES